MKVIIIKQYQKYKINDIIEVSNGFGKNFLIKNGYAVPINESTKKELEIKKDNYQKEQAKLEKESLELKEKIERLELVFSLKVTNDVVHGSISSKKINQELITKGFKLAKHIIPSVHINSLGVTKIKLKLFHNVEAILKVRIIGEYGK